MNKDNKDKSVLEFYETESDSSESEENHLSWDDYCEKDISSSNMPFSPSSSDEATVDKTDLAAVIAVNSRNNYGKIVSLKYFRSGRESYPEHPTSVCEKSVKQWIADINARTKDNWTDDG